MVEEGMYHRQEELKYLAKNDLLRIEAVMRHHSNEHMHKKMLTSVQKAQRTLSILQTVYKTGSFSQLLNVTGTRYKIADSRNPWAKNTEFGYIVYLNSEGVRITNDENYELKDQYPNGVSEYEISKPLTADTLAKRFAENGDDRIVAQMANFTPSRLMIKLKKITG